MAPYFAGYLRGSRRAIHKIDNMGAFLTPTRHSPPARSGNFLARATDMAFPPPEFAAIRYRLPRTARDRAGRQPGTANEAMPANKKNNTVPRQQSLEFAFRRSPSVGVVMVVVILGSRNLAGVQFLVSFMTTTASSLTAALKSEAQRLGFELAGVCPAVEPAGLARFREWLAAGYAGEMHYLSSRAEAYAHPRHVLDGARSIVMLALNYRTVEPSEPQPGHGRVSRYAWGADYHDVIRRAIDGAGRPTCSGSRQRRRCARSWSTRHRSWNAILPNSRGWAGSEKTRCC